METTEQQIDRPGHHNDLGMDGLDGTHRLQDQYHNNPPSIVDHHQSRPRNKSHAYRNSHSDVHKSLLDNNVQQPNGTTQKQASVNAVSGDKLPSPELPDFRVKTPSVSGPDPPIRRGGSTGIFEGKCPSKEQDLVPVKLNILFSKLFNQ